MRSILLIFLLSALISTNAQSRIEKMIDSLENVARTTPDDSPKVRVYGMLGQLYYSVNPMKSFEPAEKGLKLAEKLKWKKAVASFHNDLGLFISDTGNFALGNVHFEQALKVNEELGSIPDQINNLNNIGRNLQFESDLTTAATYFFKALKIAEDNKNDDQMALVGTNLASCFFRQKNYEKTTEYAEYTIKHARAASNSRHELNGLSTLGQVKMVLKDTAAAISYLNQAVKICEETNNQTDLIKVLSNLSLTVYPDYKKAITLMLRIDSIVRAINPGSETELGNSFNLAEAYHKLAAQSTGAEKIAYRAKALERLERAKDLANERPEQNMNMLLLQSDIEEETGNYKSALEHFRRSTAISDSLFSQEKKNEIAGLEGKHQLALKDNELAISNLTLTSQRKTLWGLFAGLALVIVIGLLLYRQNIARKRTNETLQKLNAQLDEANKTKARFFGILSHDLRSPIVKLVHFLELQKDSPDLLDAQSEKLHRQNISDSAGNLLNTMEAMLLWSKEQMDNFKPNIETIPVQKFFDYVRDFFQGDSGVALQFENPDGVSIRTDENYLKTIMHNLTANAMRALNKTPDATIVWSAKQEAGGVALSIRDNGPGIPAEQAKKLFETTTSYNSKNGFGLHLIRDLAKAVNHKLAVESEPGKGTKFVLSV